MDTITPDRQRRAYTRDLLVASAGYCAALFVVKLAVGKHLDNPLEWALMVLPVLPVLWGVRAVVRHLRELDEYQRILQLQSLAAGFGAVMVTAITLGFAGIASTVGDLAGLIVFMVGIVTWSAVQILQCRRA
jgi:hypothetical protein